MESQGENWSHRQGEAGARAEPHTMGQGKGLTSPLLAVKLEPPTLWALDPSPELAAPQPGCLYLRWESQKASLYIEQKCELRHQPQLRGVGWTLVRWRATSRARGGVAEGRVS